MQSSQILPLDDEKNKLLEKHKDFQDFHPDLPSICNAQKLKTWQSDHVPILVTIQCPDNEAKLKELKIVSWNVLGWDGSNGYSFIPGYNNKFGESPHETTERHKAIADSLMRFIDKNQPDFITLQEHGGLSRSDLETDPLIKIILEQLKKKGYPYDCVRIKKTTTQTMKDGKECEPYQEEVEEIVDINGDITFYNTAKFKPTFPKGYDIKLVGADQNLPDENISPSTLHIFKNEQDELFGTFINNNNQLITLSLTDLGDREKKRILYLIKKNEQFDSAIDNNTINNAFNFTKKQGCPRKISKALDFAHNEFVANITRFAPIKDEKFEIQISNVHHDWSQHVEHHEAHLKAFANGTDSSGNFFSSDPIKRRYSLVWVILILQALLLFASAKKSPIILSPVYHQLD